MLSTPTKNTAKRPRTDATPEREQQGTKEVACVIHHSITLEPLLVAVANTPQFQRLHHLAQLGMSTRVYPCAKHSRFEHSLGVAHLAGEFLRQVQRCSMPNGISPPSDRDILCVKLAGLVHDLGHGPYSHTFDTKVVPAARARALANENLDLAKQLEGHTHERATLRMLRVLLSENGLRLNHDVDLRFVEELIVGKDLEGGVQARRGRGIEKWYLYDVISNADSGFDVDKIDYLLRDPRCALGVMESNFMLKRLIDNVAVRKACFPRGSGGGSPGQFEEARGMEVRPVLCFPSKSAADVLKVFEARNRFHEVVYTHRAAVGFELVLTDFLLAADRLTPVLVMGGRTYHLGETVLDMAAYRKMDDRILTRYQVAMEAEREALDAAGQPPSEELLRAEGLLARLEDRKLGHYRFLGKWLLDAAETDGSRAYVAERQSEYAEELARTYAGGKEAGAVAAALFHVELQHVHYGKKGANPLDSMRFYSKRDRGADALAEELGCADELGLSHMPCKFESKFFRCFWKGEGGADLERARAAFKAFKAGLKVSAEARGND